MLFVTAEATVSEQIVGHFGETETFDPGDFLKSRNLRFVLDDARYLVHLVLTKLANGSVDQKGWVRLHGKHLRNVMHQTLCTEIIGALIAGGAILRTSYCRGERSYGYMLADRFCDVEHVRVPAEDVRLIKRLDLFHNRIEKGRRDRMLPVHLALEDRQRGLAIHGDCAEQILRKLPVKSNPYDVQGILVADIVNGDYHVNVGRYGRLSNNVTSLKRELRASLHYAGAPLCSVDVVNCQPALLGLVAQREGCVGPDCRDAQLYCTLVQRGEFYEYMIDALAGSGITREKLKARFLTDVVAKKKANQRGAEYPSDVEDKFRELFPTIYRLIRRCNKDGWEHHNLIRRLQRAESHVVIETVAADLVSRMPDAFIITLHDAIYTTDDFIADVVSAFNTAFFETRFSMKLKVERTVQNQGTPIAPARSCVELVPEAARNPST